MWKQWVNFILGIAVIVRAYMGGGHTTFIIAGIIIAVLAIWAALEKKPQASQPMQRG
jgi:hypothetical protein